MATGDKVAATRPNGQSNQRFDLVDYQAMALIGQSFVEAANRALASTPKATAGAAVGERWLGSITANPTSGNDGLLRLDSTTFVGLDANGGLVIKPNGTAISIAIPSGGASQQVYAYVSDIAENTAVRRFIPATAPFTEFPQAINTALQQTVALYVRAGTLGSVVPQDAVSGITRPLLFLGIATNNSGVVTFTPATNMLETVRAPASFPSTDSGTTTAGTTVTGSQNTLRELVNAALYVLGNAMWKGSDGSSGITPADGNNWGAYSLPAGGVDKAFKQALGYVTIGDGVSTFGDFNANAYANSKLLLDAAVAALPTTGGTIILKRGVALTNFAGLTVTLPNSKTVEIVGDHSSVPGTSPNLSFAAGESIICGSGTLTIRNCHVRWVGNAIQMAGGPLNVRDCFFEKQSGTDSGAAITSAVAISGLDIRDCIVSVTLTAGVTNAMFVRLASRADTVSIRRVQANLLGSDCGVISIADVRSNIKIEDVAATVTGSFTLNPSIVSLNTTDNTTQIYGRIVRRVTTQSTTLPLINLNSCGHLTIENCDTPGISLLATAWGGAGPITVRNTRQGSISVVGTITDFKMHNCSFTSSGSTIGSTTAAIGAIEFIDCKFYGATGITTALTVNAQSAKLFTFVNCFFDSYGSTTVQDFGIVKFVVGQATGGVAGCDQLNITNNTCRNFQNVAWAGSDTTHSPRWFECDGAFGIIRCIGNTMKHVADTSTGALRMCPYLLDLNSFNRSSTTGYQSYVYLEGNIIGGDNTPSASIVDAGGLLIAANTVISRLVASYNEVSQISAQSISTPGTGGWAGPTPYLLPIINVTVVADPNQVTVTHNTFSFNAGLLSGCPDCLFVSGVAGTNSVISFSYNTIAQTGAGGGWDDSNYYGVHWNFGAIIVLVCELNVANGSGTTFRTKGGTASATLPSGGVPGAGVAWSNNLNVYGG